MSYGWRGGNFKIEVAADPEPAADAGPRADADAPDAPIVPPHERTLGDTFEEFVHHRGRAATRPSCGSRPGPGTARQGRAVHARGTGIVRRGRGAVPRVRRHRAGPHRARLGVGLAREPRTLARHPACRCSTRSPPRSFRRASSNPTASTSAPSRRSARSTCRTRATSRALLDATTSPDAAFRCLAAAKLELADPLLVAKPWTRSLEDSSRAVRRAAIRAMAHVARPDLRLLFERALADKDACVRYYALRGLAQIGVGRADQSVERRKLDDDLRVRFAAQAALDGRVPL